MKGVKRKVEEAMPNLPSQSDPPATSPLPSPDVNAPSPSSSTGSDLELPDAFTSAETLQSSGLPFSSSMDLDARITSFLAAGSQAVNLTNFFVTTRN